MKDMRTLWCVGGKEGKAHFMKESHVGKQCPFGPNVYPELWKSSNIVCTDYIQPCTGYCL